MKVISGECLFCLLESCGAGDSQLFRAKGLTAWPCSDDAVIEILVEALEIIDVRFRSRRAVSTVRTACVAAGRRVSAATRD